jgi:hypothetical protein
MANLAEKKMELLLQVSGKNFKAILDTLYLTKKCTERIEA